jgi:sugar phosphate isomerase/epimerase
MPKFSISEVTTRDWSFVEDVHHYAALGIQGIGVWRDKLDRCEDVDPVALLAGSGLQAANLVNAGHFMGMTRSQTRRAIEDAIEAIGLAQRLGAGVILIVTGEVGSFFSTVDEARAITVAALKELAPVARAAGVRLGVEPIAARYPGYTFLRDIPQTLDVIDAVGAAEVGLFFDTDHLYQSPNLFRDIETAGDRIFCVHINDVPAVPGPGIDRRILGDGVIPLREILHAIAATGYDGFYDVEIMSDSVWGMDYVALIDTLKARFDALWL